MLKKLLKHDFLAQKRMLMPLLASVLIAGLATGLLSFLIIQLNAGETAEVFLFLFVMLTTYFCFISIAITAIYTYVHFYQNLMTDEGYLSHTLPVTATQQICSKFVTSLLWQFIAILCALASLAIMYVLLLTTIEPQVWAQIKMVFEQFKQAFLSGFGVDFFSWLWIWLGLLMITDTFTTIFMVYLAISIGSISATKHKVVTSIAMIFGLNIARGIVTQILASVFREISLGAGMENFKMLIITIFINIIIAITCFFLTKNFMEKKLNI